MLKFEARQYLLAEYQVKLNKIFIHIMCDQISYLNLNPKIYKENVDSFHVGHN